MANTNVNAENLEQALKLANTATQWILDPANKKSKDSMKNDVHNQAVEIKLGNEQAQKPIIVHDKKETHIHKPFPDGRELSERECEVETLRLQLEAEDKKAEREFRMKMEEAFRAERKEREAYERAQRERRQKRERRISNGLLVAGGICCAVGLGMLCYDLYTGTRYPGSPRLVISAQKPVNGPTVIEAEGSVK